MGKLGRTTPRLKSSTGKKSSLSRRGIPNNNHTGHGCKILNVQCSLGNWQTAQMPPRKGPQIYLLGLELSVSVRWWWMEVWFQFRSPVKFHSKQIQVLKNLNLRICLTEFYSFQEGLNFTSCIDLKWNSPLHKYISFIITNPKVKHSWVMISLYVIKIKHDTAPHGNIPFYLDYNSFISIWICLPGYTIIAGNERHESCFDFQKTKSVSNPVWNQRPV